METLHDALRKLTADCETLAGSLTHQRLATAADLAPHQPGGAENADEGFAGWLRYYAKLHRIHAIKAEAPAVSPVVVADAIAKDRLRLAALNEEPVTVATSAGDRQVYPKSKWALDEVAECERRIGFLSTHRDRVEGSAQTAEALDLLHRIDVEIGYQLALLAWIATTEGPGLPYDPFHVTQATPPGDLLELSPIDLLGIQRGFVEANLVRLLALREQTKAPKPDDPPPMWSGFYAGRAHETGVPARTLYRDRSLAGLVAESAITAEAHEKAREEAERERAAKERREPAMSTIPRG